VAALATEPDAAQSVSFVGGMRLPEGQESGDHARDRQPHHTEEVRMDHIQLRRTAQHPAVSA
jgi:hypothetical protein